MNLYLDDDSAKASLVKLLKKAGHQVAIPADAGLTGVSDPRHLMHTVQHNWVLLTKNHDDFEDLHLLLQAAGGKHAGLLVVRSDNNPSRDSDKGDRAKKGIFTFARCEKCECPLFRAKNVNVPFSARGSLGQGRLHCTCLSLGATARKAAKDRRTPKKAKPTRRSIPALQTRKDAHLMVNCTACRSGSPSTSKKNR